MPELTDHAGEPIPATKLALARALAHELEWEALMHQGPLLRISDRLANLAEDMRRLLDGEEAQHDWLSDVRSGTYPPAARALLGLIADHRPRCNEQCTINFLTLLPSFEAIVGRSASELEKRRFM